MPMSSVLDLGDFGCDLRGEGPVMVFGGPYSNYEATFALKQVAEHLAIPSERCICTGDVVAYCADPMKTVDLVRNWGVTVVMGNCEKAFASESEDCSCGFEEGTACDALSRQWFAYANTHLDTESRRWMGGLSRQVRFRLAGRRVAAIHGGINDISHFIFASTSEEEKRRQAALVDVDIILAGHCGIPFSQKLSNGVIWHNAGAVGMPANDGTPDVWYTLLWPAGDRLKIFHHRLGYDHFKAAERMQQEGLPQGYAKALETGLWPSLDVLPPVERAATGRRLVFRPSYGGVVS